MNQKDYSPSSSCLHSKDVGVLQHIEINICNTSHKCASQYMRKRLLMEPNIPS